MRYPLVLAAALVAAGLGPLPASRLAAQVRQERRMEEPDQLMRIVMNRRARLGIKVNLQARDTDTLGAYVESVTPNGPAATAGLRSGDVITKLDGHSVLAGGSAEPSATDRQSLPGLRLIELAARLEPADTVQVEYLRGKDRRTVSLVTEDEPVAMRFFRQRGMGDGMPLPAAGFMDMGPGERFEFMAGSPLGDLELAPLNSDLGQYFGTTEGVLVIHAPAEGGLGLKGGDVVQAVDGRKPSSPAHLLRILRSYDRGETFKLDILRNRKRDTITARLAESER
jgi:S1-C subfamily serine protease